MGNKRHTVVVMEELSRPKLTSNNVSMFKPEAVSLPKFRIREIWTAMTDYCWNVHGNDVIQKRLRNLIVPPVSGEILAWIYAIF